MSGIYNGVQAVVKEKYPLATYVHCASHCLNLTIAKAASVQSIRNAQDVLSETVNFVKGSAKRSIIFAECLSTMENQESAPKLRSFCETRWVERHDAIIIFCNMYPAIISFLHRCIDLDANTATKARMLLTACSCPDFIVAISTLWKMLAITKPVSVSLQKVGIDLN